MSPAEQAEFERWYLITDFDREYGGTLSQVKADIAAGGALGIRSTPTFFINKRMIRGGMTPQAFDAAIAYELRASRTAGQARSEGS